MQEKIGNIIENVNKLEEKERKMEEIDEDDKEKDDEPKTENVDLLNLGVSPENNQKQGPAKEKAEDVNFLW